MDEQQIKDYIRYNLTIVLSQERTCFGESGVSASLVLDGEVIASDFVVIEKE